jgi:Transcription factor e(y)2
VDGRKRLNLFVKKRFPSVMLVLDYFILEQITVDDLVSIISPKARSLVPDQVKAELLQKIRLYLKELDN